uniref:RNA dependent RNA polymerase n=1 Tax=Nigrospora sphaerica mitovirus 1 TaxID=2851966 RepID=A0A915Y434_9VIRU|nr:RNA dependent RNA polymerase [Nigrospora sphaerica mitovirus 1]
MKKQNNKLIINQFIACFKLSKTLITWFWADIPGAADTSHRVIGRLVKMSQTRGIVSAIDDMKSARLAVTKFIAGQPLTGHVGTPIWKDGLPKVLGAEVAQLVREKDPRTIKLVLTLLSISRYALGLKPVQLKPITDPGWGQTTLPDSEIILALSKLAIPRNQEPPIKHKFEWITTAGPNGPSISTCLTDLRAFLEEFSDEAKVLVPFLTSKLETLIDWDKKIKLTKLLKLEFKFRSLRKLSIKPDKEGKSRIFAMLDYWSQTALGPLHDHLYKTLKKIDRDCTFDQHSGLKLISDDSSNEGKYYSIDLKSATDRFPVELQEKVLAAMFNKKYASSWRSLMTRLPFFFSDDKELKNPIKWAVGQPLGAKSSWAMFTLTHHVLVQIAAMRTNSTANYVILGDDIVIRGDKLAEEYLKILAFLGVETSEAKTHASYDTFEFAKVWIHRGANVSPFPISGILDLWQKPIELASLLVEELPRKGYDLLLCPRSLAIRLSELHRSYPYARLGTYYLNLTAEAVALISWMSSHSDDWAKFIAQMAKVEDPSAVRNNQLLLYSVNLIWRSMINQRVDSLRAFSWDMARKIPDSLAFIGMDDDDLMISGSTDGYSLQFPEHLVTNVPIFQALEIEFKKSSELMDVLSRPIDLLTGDEMKSLTLPPVAQLKGFEPQRTKTGVVAVSMLSRFMKNLIRQLSTVRSNA